MVREFILEALWGFTSLVYVLTNISINLLRHLSFVPYLTSNNFQFQIMKVACNLFFLLL